MGPDSDRPAPAGVLTDDELVRIWERDVRPYVFRNATTSADPVAVLLGGQPGAGKTRAARLVSAGIYGAGTLTGIATDELRAFHPEYDATMANDPLAMPALTAHAAGRWVEMSIDHALTHGHSLLIEGTWRRPEIALATAQRAADAGFYVHAVVVAVAPVESRLSTLERYYDAVRRELDARWTPPEAHEEAANVLPSSLYQLGLDDAVSRVTVVTRDAVVLADLADRLGDDVDARERRGRAAHDALVAGMRRPLTSIEAGEWLRRARDLYAVHQVHTRDNAEAVSVWQQIRARDVPTVEAIALGTSPRTPGSARAPQRGRGGFSR